MYAGGGHQNAGTCQVANDKAEAVLKELIVKSMLMAERGAIQALGVHGMMSLC